MNLPTEIKDPGLELASSAKRFGECLRDELRTHDDFYFFSPDETTSNRLSAVYEASNRAWVRRTEAWDKYLSSNGQ